MLKSWLVGSAGAVVLAALTTIGSAVAQETPRPAPDAAQLALGEDVWTNAGCAACHGERGEGGTSKDQPNGPSFRDTALDHELLVEAIACGRPETSMAAWVIGAYKTYECYGETGGAPEGTMVIGYLSPEDIEALVDFIEVKLK